MKSIIIFSLSVVAVLAELPKQCGKSNTEKPGPVKNVVLIIGGEPAKPGEFPWQMMVRDNAGGLCGGSLINEQWVLTAAHCVDDSHKASDYTIREGVIDLTKNDTEEGRKLSVSKVISHEDYHGKGVKIVNDIALIKLAKPLNLTEDGTLQPICLARPDTKLTDKCVVTGFGLTSWSPSDHPLTGGKRSDRLNKLDLPLTEDKRCGVYPHFDAKQHLCGGGLTKGGKGTCKGDSGGPYGCRGEDGRLYQVGVVSYSVPCAHLLVPSVFTRVSHYIPWIEKTIAKN